MGVSKEKGGWVFVISHVPTVLYWQSNFGNCGTRRRVWLLKLFKQNITQITQFWVQNWEVSPLLLREAFMEQVKLSKMD
jgi:hypothetical protein